MKILFVCERSAGHIFPALALAEKIKNDKIYFFVTNASLHHFLRKKGYCVYGRSFSYRNLIVEGFYRLAEAIYLLFKLKPRRIIGFGGRDSFFLLFFGSLLFLDTAIYELNVHLGKTNKILSFFVRNILCGFEETIKGRKVKVAGIPLRAEIKKIDRKEARRLLNFDDSPVILCFGGSSGSAFLNRIFLRLIQNMEGKYQIIHLTGKKNYFKTLQAYNTIERKKFIKDFSYSMGLLYSCADLAICRAGASTLAEIVYYQLPSILIPHSYSEGHQKYNAFYLKEKKAAFVFLEDNFSFEKFKLAVRCLLYNEDLRREMRNNLNRIRLGVTFEELGNF
jgi:UDP-N-acetylglucosamine--N-acetylmuramyl-(pentapeptide) pyrophosphoryl-undecaprenol N-acetylglucosamine transferase